jgi:hypothetical protein
MIVALSELRSPMLRRPGHTQRARRDRERARLDRCGIVHRQCERIADALGAQQHRVEQRGRRHTAVGADEIPIQIAGVAAQRAVCDRLERDRPIERVHVV